jgi:hypothetical protein
VAKKNIAIKAYRLAISLLDTLRLLHYVRNDENSDFAIVSLPEFLEIA